MNAAVLVYWPKHLPAEAVLCWLDPLAGRVLQSLAVPMSPNLGVFPQHDCVLLSYTDYPERGAPADWLEVYRFSDWSLRARLPMDCRAHFNVCPLWSTFVPSPDRRLIYVYKSRALGDHRAEDFVCGLDPRTWAFTPWNFALPECVAGWSAGGGRAHAQMLFVGDGLEEGSLRFASAEQKLAFWLGPEEGMGPVLPLGLRPRVHSAPGHARAVLCAPQRPLSVVVCTDGVAHLIDPVGFRYLERHQVELAAGQAMPIFAAQLDPQGRWLYVGSGSHQARHQGLVERVVVHDLQRGRRQGEWRLEEPFGHMALSADGRYLYGTSPASGRLWVLDAATGAVQALTPLDGTPMYVLPAEGPC